MANYGEGVITLDQHFCDLLMQAVGDFFFLGCMCAVLLVIIVGLLLWLSFRSR